MTRIHLVSKSSFPSLSLVAFEGYAIANLTIRLHGDPAAINQQIEKRWLQEELTVAIERLLKRLHENTQQAKTFNQLSIARLDYCLPLFKVGSAAVFEQNLILMLFI